MRKKEDEDNSSELAMSVGDRAAMQLSDALSNVVGRHGLVGEVYVMITSPLGLESDVFTRPYQVYPGSGGDVFGADSLDEVGNLNPTITIAEHIAAVIARHPRAAVVLDQETAIGLSTDPQRPVTLIDYGDDHCLLTGLSSHGIDVFLTCPMDVIRTTPGLSVIEFKP